MITLTLARTVIRLYAENIALRLLNALEEDRADVAEQRITLTPAGVAALDKELLEKRLGEALDEVARSRGTITRLEADLLAERRRITPALSTAQVKERTYLQWEALNAHGWEPLPVTPLCLVCRSEDCSCYRPHPIDAGGE
jgi:hypothetical protein